ncbi:MAG TPA: DMT family transporter [Kofleriaceae bacterium]|nr:DMT family transporter [Kofleriaceae bacterium]
MLVAACYLVCALVWSTTWFAIRVCIGEGGYPTFAAAAIRFTVAAALLGLVLQLGYGRPGPRTRRQLGWLVAAGLCNAICYSMVYLSEESLPGGLVAVLFGTYPLFTALFASLTGTEKVRPADIGAATLSLAGMAILFWDRMSVSPDQATGVAFALGGVLATVAYNLILKREAGEVNPLASTTVFLSVAAAALWFAAIPEGPSQVPWPPPAAPTAALLYLAVFGSVVTFGCYFYLLKRVTLMTASSLVLIQPVLALLVDAVWEQDVRLVGRSYVGVAVTLAGVALGLVWKWRAARHTRPG